MLLDPFEKEFHLPAAAASGSSTTVPNSEGRIASRDRRFLNGAFGRDRPK